MTEDRRQCSVLRRQKEERRRRKAESRWQLADGRREREQRGRRRSLCAEMRSRSGSIRPNPTQAGLGTILGWRELHGLCERVIEFHPVRSDQIRPKPVESDRMKSIIECNCTMIEAARWIATSGREGRRQEKDARLNNETLASSTMLSLLNGYRARRSRSTLRSTSLPGCFRAAIPFPRGKLTLRSTSLPGCFRRFAERRIAALDERFRLLTTSYVAGVGGYRLSTSFAACPHDFAPGIPCPSPVAGNSSAGAKDVAKTKPNVGRVQDWKTSFFSGNTNISIRPGVGCENMFLRNEPK